MQGALAIANRECWDKRMVLVAAFVAGLMPFAAPLLPGVKSGDGSSSVLISAAVLALGFGLVLAVSLGATAIGRDLGNRRIGFDLARPVGEFSIWAGRLGAAWVISAAAMAIVIGPALLVGLITGSLSRFGADYEWGGLAAVLGALFLLVPLAHVVGVVLRRRSAWIGADFAAAAVLLIVAALAIRRLLNVFAYQSAIELAVVAAVASIPALWIASAVQLIRGRGDLAAGHRAQSLVLWPLLAVVVVGLHGYAAWFVAVEPEDLVNVYPHGASQGNWIAVSGTAAGREDYAPTFLLDPETDRSIPLGARGWVGGNVLFSADGRRAVWLQRDGDGTSGVTVRTVDLDAPDPVMAETRVRFSALMSPVTGGLSSTGRYLAGMQDEQLAVHDLDDGRIVASVRIPSGMAHWNAPLVFLPGDRRLRVYAILEDRLQVLELDLDTKQQRRFEAEGTGSHLRWTLDHQRLLLIRNWGESADMLDGEEGTLLWSLPPVPDNVVRAVDFLGDGRVVFASAGDGVEPSLTILSPEGELLSRIELPYTDADVSILGFEIAPGRLLVGLAEKRLTDKDRPDRRVFAVDTASGEVVPVEAPDAMPWRWWRSIPRAQIRPGSAASRLLLGNSCDVLFIDPETLATRRILGGTCPAKEKKEEDEAEEAEEPA